MKQSPPRKNAFVKQDYCNDHFNLVKLGADSFLIEAVVANWGSFICCYKLVQRLLEIEHLVLLQIRATVNTNGDRIITNQDRFVSNLGSYYKLE